MTPTGRAICLFLMVLGFGSGSGALGAPGAEPWPRWAAHVAGSTAAPDHGAWSRLLSVYLEAGEDGINRFDYAGVTAADRAALDAYIATLAAFPVSTADRPEQLAYWINLYNALTVQVVLDHYPVATIRDIDISGPFADGPWGKKLVSVEATPVSLNDIEHRILRPLWRDPRVHYGVNCAALSCPNLGLAGYRGARVASQLDAAARDYVNHPRGVSLRGGKLEVSSIYNWYKSDFGGDQGVIRHLREYAGQELAARLESVTRISGDHYDWSLNDATADPRPGQAAR